jgi:hypothetical protein
LGCTGAKATRAYRNSHFHRDPDAYRLTDPNHDSHTHPYPHADAEPHTYRHAHANPESHAYYHAHAGSFTDGKRYFNYNLNASVERLPDDCHRLALTHNQWGMKRRKYHFPRASCTLKHFCRALTAVKLSSRG